MEIPTRQFRVQGRKGKFSVDRKPQKFVGGKEGYQAYWSTAGANWKQVTAFGETREAALQNVLSKGLNIIV